MGWPVSSVVANIFIASLEQCALESAGDARPSYWKRYIDDVFSICLKKHIESFLCHLNSLDSNIIFTIQRDGRRLPFLDVNVHRDTNEKLQTSVYRKPTSTDRVLNFNWHHPNLATIAAISALFNCVEMHFQDSDLVGKEKERSWLYQVIEMWTYIGKHLWAEHCTDEADRSKGASLKLHGELYIPYVWGLGEPVRENSMTAWSWTG